MSRGRGHVQRAIINIFGEQPTGRFTVEQLCELVYTDEIIVVKHKHTVRRALRSLEDDLNLTWNRVGKLGETGWTFE